MRCLDQEFYAVMCKDILKIVANEYDFKLDELTRSDLLRLQGHLDNIVENPPKKLKNAPSLLIQGAIQNLNFDIANHLNSMDDSMTVSIISTYQKLDYISKEDLKKPEFRELRNNLRAIYGTQPTTVGTLLTILATLGEFFFTVAIVVVFVVDTKYTFTQMLIGLVASFALRRIASVYDKKFAEINDTPPQPLHRRH